MVVIVGMVVYPPKTLLRLIPYFGHKGLALSHNVYCILKNTFTNIYCQDAGYVCLKGISKEML